MIAGALQKESLPTTCSKAPSLMQLIERGRLAHPLKTMITDGEVRFTYAQSSQQAREFARNLHYELGLGSGSIVLIAASNVVEFPSLLAACQSLGLRVGLMSANMGKLAWENAINLLHPDVAIIEDESCRLMIHDADPQMEIARMRHFVKGMARLELVFQPDDASFSFAFFQEHDENAPFILFTSGTSGEPKGIVNLPSSLYANAVKLTGALRLTGKDTLYVPVPFSHVYGLIGIYSALCRGGGLVVIKHYHPEASLSLIESVRPSMYFGVATMFVRELQATYELGIDSLSIRVGLVAGSSCPKSIIRSFQERFGCILVQSYGMTETAATLTVNTITDPLSVRMSSVGKAIEGVCIKIDEQKGEVLVKTPSMMIGTIEGKGEDAFLTADDGWFHTGDAGRLDTEGNLYITGRIKDMIIRGGINIFPVEIESLYQDSPDVLECCLVGYPDRELGERTCLCVILRHPEEEAALDLRSYAKGRIGKCKLPDTIAVMNDFPRLSNGKIDKTVIRRRVRSYLDPARG